MTTTSVLPKVPIEAIANGLHFRLSKNEQWVALKIEDGTSASVRVHSLASPQQAYTLAMPNPIMGIHFSPDTEEVIITQKQTITYWDFQKDNTTAYDISPFIDDTFLDHLYDPERKRLFLLKKGQLLTLSLENESPSILQQVDARTAYHNKLFQSSAWVGLLPGVEKPQTYRYVAGPDLWSKDDLSAGQVLAGDFNEARSASLAKEEYHLACAKNANGFNTELIIHQYFGLEKIIQLEGVNATNSRLQFLDQDRILLYYAMHTFYFFDVETSDLLEEIHYQSKSEPEEDWLVDFAVSADESSIVLLMATNHKDNIPHSFELVLEKISVAHLHQTNTNT
ncbi:MAG: hypothetical protein AAFO02_07255 [Bacteroidota bacterium]